MRGYTTSEKLVYWLTHDGIPATKLIIVVNVFTFLLAWMKYGGYLEAYLGFHVLTALRAPWTLFTYPLLGMIGPIGLLFGGYWLWIAGGSLERTWGTRTFVEFFFVISAISAAGLYLGHLATGAFVAAIGLWLPLAAVTVAFAMLNPEQTILFMFIIPLKLKYLAALSAGLVFLSYGAIGEESTTLGSQLFMGLFALSGCAAGYWYARHGTRLDLGRSRWSSRDNVIRIKPSGARQRRTGLLGWYKEYRDRKRLKDLFERSNHDDER